MSSDDFSSTRIERKSSAVISSKIGYKASLAASIQSIVEVRPGNITRYHNYNDFKIENYLKYAVTLNQPIIDLTTRGVMVERGFMEMDEVEMGWILTEAIKQHPVKHGYDHYIGMLLSFAPLATAAGYIISEKNEEIIEYKELKSVSFEFLENTTPEDADALFSTLYDLELDRFKFINDFSETKIEGSNRILEEEINLLDLYGFFSSQSLIFSEMNKNYEFCFGKGMDAFYEAIENKVSIPDAITHTYLHVLANNPPKLKKTREDPHISYRIKQEALDIIEQGGYLTSKGKLLTGKFENYILNYKHPIVLQEIAELTATISYIAFMKEKNLFDSE